MSLSKYLEFQNKNYKSYFSFGFSESERFINFDILNSDISVKRYWLKIISKAKYLPENFIIKLKKFPFEFDFTHYS